MSVPPPTAPLSPRISPTLARLFGAWLLIGFQSFGGGGATLALINASLVERFGWVTEEEFSRDWSICQVAPGINLLALAVRLGSRIGSICGSGAAGVALSLAGLVLPSAAITIGITGAYARIHGDPAVQAALRDVIPATVGLGLLTAWNIARPLLKASRSEGRSSAGVTVALIVGAALALALWRLPVLAVLLAGGALGAAYHIDRAHRRSRSGSIDETEGTKT